VLSCYSAFVILCGILRDGWLDSTSKTHLQAQSLFQCIRSASVKIEFTVFADTIDELASAIVKAISQLAGVTPGAGVAASVNIRVGERQPPKKGEAAISKIISLCERPGGETFGVITNRIRSASDLELRKLIAELVMSGHLREAATYHPRNGKEFMRYQSTGKKG